MVMSMIKPELSLFKMQLKGMLSNAIKLSQSAFSETPKRLDTIYMRIAPGKFIVAMVDPMMFIKPDIHQTIVATPAISMNHTGNVHLASDNGLQDSFRRIRDDFSVNIIPTLQKSKDHRLTSSASTSLASHTLGTKVRLIGLQLARKRRSLGTSSAHARANTKVDGINAAHRNTAQCSALSGGQIKRKVAHNLTKLGFAEFRTPEVPVFLNHRKKLACVDYMFAS